MDLPLQTTNHHASWSRNGMHLRYTSLQGRHVSYTKIRIKLVHNMKSEHTYFGHRIWLCLACSHNSSHAKSYAVSCSLRFLQRYIGRSLTLFCCFELVLAKSNQVAKVWRMLECSKQSITNFHFQRILSLSSCQESKPEIELHTNWKAWKLSFPRSALVMCKPWTSINPSVSGNLVCALLAAKNPRLGLGSQFVPNLGAFKWQHLLRVCMNWRLGPCILDNVC